MRRVRREGCQRLCGVCACAHMIADENIQKLVIIFV